MRHSLRSKTTGRFIRNTPAQIVAGRLYGYRGTVVRAGHLTTHDGKRYVLHHKDLSGFIPEKDLKLISKEKVKEYLQNA